MKSLPLHDRRRPLLLGGAVLSAFLLMAATAKAETPATPASVEAAPTPEARREPAAEPRPDTRPDGKKPQVRTYTSVMVVDDPAKIPRLPTPSRGPTEMRENVRELRREIQDLRRELRREREGAAGRPGEGSGPARAASPAAAARPNPPGNESARPGGPAAGRAGEREHPLREAAGLRGERPATREREPSHGEGRPAPPPAR